MGGEGGAPLEALPALLALEQLLGAVDRPEQSTVKPGQDVVPLLPHLCWLRLISWPKVLLQSSQAKGLKSVMRPRL